MYKIEEIQKVIVNHKKVKIFSAFEYDAENQRYVYIGKFSAPFNVSDENLVKYIPSDEE